MVSSFRLRAKRTTGSEPPEDMLFGELAYSDGDQQLYIGRPTGPPATFISDLSPITGDIAVLATTTSDQALEIAALATSDQAQDTALAALILADTTTTAALALKLEADDIASFESSTQLDSRDTANRSRGNHTGTQAAATVTGLAAVATSGAYSDLSEKPTTTYGLTYDQQAEPSSPAAGATWRERAASGAIVGTWEWSGSLWLSVAEYSIMNPKGSYVNVINGVSASGNSGGTYPGILPPPQLGAFTIHSVYWRFSSSGNDANNYWKIQLKGLNVNGVTIAEDTPQTNTSPGILFITQLLSPFKVFTNNVLAFRIDVEKVGSPGALFISVFNFRGRTIR